MLKTSQERLWSSEFGDNYIERNRHLLRTNHWSKILSGNINLHSINSILEFGANIGVNLDTLHNLMPHATTAGIEINAKACTELSVRHIALNQSAIEYQPTQHYDLVFTFVFLIHLNPEYLQEIYSKIYVSSSRYIVIAEYFNPFPVSVQYRGQDEALYKRDFCGEILAKYPTLRLVDYGFFYKLDTICPEDNITWWLLEKTDR